MKIRTANVADAKTISGIIRSLSQSFFTAPDGKGAEAFLESISETAVAGYIARGNFAYYVCEEMGEIVGIVAVRDNTQKDVLKQLLRAENTDRAYIYTQTSVAVGQGMTTFE